MRLGIMQPYFFPYLGHFSLIAATDRWIVFDVTQYTPKSWMNRNRIVHPSGGWKWLTVPLGNGSIHIRTFEARLADPAAARSDTLNQLSHYRTAPFFSAVCDLVADVFTADPSLTKLNTRALEAVCRYIGLAFDPSICSDLNLPLPSDLQAGDWAREICRALGAAAYVNPIGGRALFDPTTFARAGVSLHFLHSEPFEYKPGRFDFSPNLSILDVLMWNSPTVVRDAVSRFELIQAEELLPAASCA